MDKHVVRIAQMLFPSLPRFAVPVPIVKLKLMQLFEQFLVEFGLQFKSEIWKTALPCLI